MNSSGYGSGQRPSAQQGYEAPACVQNAMMTKDKKPFTYTPGGIDLSQIKSERMAKRLARNALAEGATGNGPQQNNRPAQPQSPSGGNTSATAAMGAAAMGMPFQVLPPPPPPAPAMGFKKSIPTTTTNLQPETNNNNNYQHYSSPQALQQQEQQATPQYSPQQYSAPPLQPKAPTSPQQIVQQQPQSQSPRPEFRSVAAPQSPAVNVYTRQTDSPRLDAGTGTPPPRATDSPFRFAQQQQQPLQQQQRNPPTISPLAQQPPQQSITPTIPSAYPTQQAQTVPWRTQRAVQPNVQAPPPSQQQQLQQQQPSLQQQSHPQPIYNNVQPALQQQQQQQQQQRARDVLSPAQEYNGPKPTNIGSLYIAPLAPTVEPQAQNIVRQQLQQQQRDSPLRQMPQAQPQLQQQQRQPARWMTAQNTPREQPEWARPEENGNVVPSSLQRQVKSPPPSVVQQPLIQGNGYGPPGPTIQNFGVSPVAGSTGLRLQINTTNTSNPSGPKERIIPIQLEQTPTYGPTQPSFPPFGPGNVNAASPGYVIRSPNQFVDQGYNNYPASAQSPPQQQQRAPSVQRVMSPTQQLNAPRIIQQQQQQQQTQVSGGGTRTRIIPIAVEGVEGTRGPISQSPIVIQNGNYNLIVHDCPLEAEIRYRKNRLSDPRTPPVQSKSFRILQKITDTIDDGSSDGGVTPSGKNDHASDGVVEPQLQRPQFARQMSAQQARNSPTDQLRRMQIAHDPMQQQAWTQGNSTNQPTRYAQQRPTFNNNDSPQQYVHPSEQQVPEPKKYTGSAIPSRSFKILQAMTTPENAGPGQSDL